MKRDRNHNNTLPRRYLYTLGIVCIYILGRSVQIPWIVAADNTSDAMFAYTASILGTNTSRGSIFSLGISPWITSMIIMQILSSFFRNPGRVISKTFMRRITLIMTLFMAIIQSVTLLGQLTLKEDAFPYLWQTELASVICLVGGTFAIIALGESLTQNGIAGTTTLILVNIMTTFRINLFSYFSEPQWADVTRRGIILYRVVPLIYVIIIVFSTVLFEQSELRIPVYRVMINNDLADDNYIAIKLNPTGTMPVMFAMTFFLIPYYLIEALLKIWQDQPVLLAIKGAFSLDNFIGIILYLLMVILLNCAFSFITINPSELSKQFMEVGDCIAGMRPGNATEGYIRKCIKFCLVPSCIMQCTIVGIPLVIKVISGSDSKIFQMPITIILLTGMLLKVFEGIKVLKNFRDYKAFL